MELRILKYFLVVAQEENITRAAELLHLTQPTLSRQIMHLEKELNVKLFYRGKTKMTLTDEGMLLRRRAQEIVALTDKTERDFLDSVNLVSGVIYIGAGELYSVNYLAKLIVEFRKQYPEVIFDLYSGNADSIKEMIDKGLLDIGLVSEPADISKYDYKRIPLKEKWGVWLQKDDELAKNEVITPEELFGKSIMISKRSLVQHSFQQWFGENYQSLNVVATYDLAHNVAILVENGLGYALGLDNLIPESEERNICFRPLFPTQEIGTVFIWKKHQLFSAAATKIIERIRYAENE